MFMSYYIYTMYFPILLMSMLMIMFSNSWYSMWMIMEINMFSFIMLLFFDKKKNIMNLFNYYMIQTLNSYLFLMYSILEFYNSSMFYILIMQISLLIKMGMPPFYLWMKKMCYSMNWMNLFILLVYQKFIPLIILNKTFIHLSYYPLIILMVIISILYSTFMGLKFMNLKILMLYSSLIQNNWIIILMFFNEIYFMYYYFVYILIMTNLLMLMNFYNLKNINSLNMIMNNKQFYLFLIIMFSLSSIPPFFGFSMKIISIEMFMKYNSLINSLILIISSVISMFFYFRIIMNFMLKNFMKMKLFYLNLYYNKNNNFIIFLNFLMLFLFFMFEFFML